MSLISDIDKIDAPKIIITVVLFLATIAPGFLILYLYKNEVLFDYDIMKVIIFSFALTLPLLTINSLLVVLTIDPAESRNVKTTLGYILGALVTIVTYYITLFISYLVEWPFKTFIWWLLGINFVLQFIIFIVEFKERHKKKAVN